MRHLTVTLLLLATLAAGCAQPTAQESAELAAHAATWVEHYNAGHFEELAALYTEDARLLPPNAETITGRDAIREHFQEMSDAGLTGSLETVEAMTAGDLGYRVGTYALQMPDGSPADRGKYIETWRLVDGEWKISNDIYNSDLPAAGPQGTLLMGSHEVGDPDVWLAAWLESDARRQQFAEHGAPEVTVFQDPENPEMTGLLIDVVDMEVFRAFLDSEVGARAKAEDTVLDDTLRVLVEVE